VSITIIKDLLENNITKAKIVLQSVIGSLAPSVHKGFKVVRTLNIESEKEVWTNYLFTWNKALRKYRILSYNLMSSKAGGNTPIGDIFSFRTVL
jgi:hypothetical protein